MNPKGKICYMDELGQDRCIEIVNQMRAKITVPEDRIGRKTEC